MIPTRIRPLLMTQPAIQVVMILEATLHRIVEGLTIKSVEILRNRYMGQRFSHSRIVYLPVVKHLVILKNIHPFNWYSLCAQVSIRQ